MPRAAQGPSDDQPFRERPAVVRAGRAGREHVVAAPHEHERLTPCMTEQRLAVLELRELDSFGEIRSRELRVC